MNNKQLPFQASSDMVLAIHAVEEAAIRVNSIYKSAFEVSYKRDGESVTKADIESNDVIRQILSASGYPILSEETLDTRDRFSKERLWVVDPLDGTNDFVERTGEFSILVGLISDGKPQLGIVMQPTTSRWYVAERDKGAFFLSGGEWCRLKTVEGEARLSDFRLVMSRHHLEELEKKFLTYIGIKAFVQKGSSGLKIVDIASNYFDAYFTFTNKINQWDLSAADCILTEAGGVVTNFAGLPIIYGGKDPTINGVLAAGNARAHAQLLAAHSRFINC